MTAAPEGTLLDNIDLAERLGAKVVKLSGSGVVETLIRFAREHGVSHIIVGRSLRSRFHEIVYGSVIDGLVRAAEGIDVHVVGADPGPRD